MEGLPDTGVNLINGVSVCPLALGVAFWASYVFFNAIFPKLSHDLPEVREAHARLLDQTITEEEYQRRCSLTRSRVMNHSYGWNNLGFTVCCALSLAALFGLHADESAAANNWGYSVAVAVCTGWWILLAIPWFFYEKRRPGPSLPPGDSYLTFGFRQAWFAAREAWHLRQAFAYLAAYFLLADGINTTLTLVAIAQTQAVQFSAVQNTYLIAVQGASAMAGVFGAYYVQVLFGLRTKTMLQVCNVGCVSLAAWGMVGIWTDTVGYHNLWEFWALNAVYGLTVGPQFSYGQAFMAELIPRGREYMFFSLLGIVSKGSAWIGPIVSSAIVDQSGNQWTPFAFVAALTLVPTVGIFFISEEKAREEATAYLSREAKDLRKLEQSAVE